MFSGARYTGKLEVLAEGFNIFNRTEIISVNSTIYNVAASGGVVNLT
jgi:hypothetical protein